TVPVAPVAPTAPVATVPAVVPVLPVDRVPPVVPRSLVDSLVPVVPEPVLVPVLVPVFVPLGVVVGVTTPPAAEVPHCVGPSLPQAAGCGALFARVLVPSGANVGLWHFVMSTVSTATPGIRLTWSRPALTRLMGSGEYPSEATDCWPSHKK